MASTVDTHIPERRHMPDRRIASHPARANRLGAADWIALTLLVVGGINWGLVGLFGTDLVAALFGDMSALSRAVYTLVGFSALYALYSASKLSRS